MQCVMGKGGKRIGIFGGTFNPIHVGHMVIAKFILEDKGLDEILFVPCALPPHKGNKDLVSGEDRLRMVELAVASEPKFEASDIELRRGGKSYSIQTVEELKALFEPGAKFFFIIGADSLHEISTWKDIDRLSELCDFIVIARRGYPLSDLSPEKLTVKEGIFRRLIAGIVESPLMDVSSTDIRDRIRAGKDIESLVPEAVAEFITRRGLYKKGGQED